MQTQTLRKTMCELAYKPCFFGQGSADTRVNTAAILYKTFAHKMLMKFKPAVNFTNILQAVFVPILFCQKITNPKCK